jgi:hypothetical protein
MDEPLQKSAAAAALLESAQTPTTVEQARELFRQAQKDASKLNISILLRVWLRWAEAETKRSQFKAAKRIHEDIVSHTVLSNFAASWLTYAGFCAGRGKVRAARKIYVRGCQRNEMSSDQSSIIWDAFLEFENAIRTSTATDAANAAAAVLAKEVTAAAEVIVVIDDSVEEIQDSVLPVENNIATIRMSLQESSRPKETESNEITIPEDATTSSNATPSIPPISSPPPLPIPPPLPAQPILLTLEELKILVSQTSLPTSDVSVALVKTPSDAIGDKFKAAAAQGKIVQIEDDGDVIPIDATSTTSTTSTTNAISTSSSAPLPPSSSSTKKERETNDDIQEPSSKRQKLNSSTHIDTKEGIKTDNTNNTNTTNNANSTSITAISSNTIPLAIEQAASQAAAKEMLHYSLPSDTAPRLFTSLTKKKNQTTSSKNKMEETSNKPKVKLPREILMQLGTSLKQGGAKYVFQIVKMLRESQKLKEEELRLRR